MGVAKKSRTKNKKKVIEYLDLVDGKLSPALLFMLVSRDQRKFMRKFARVFSCLIPCLLLSLPSNSRINVEKQTEIMIDGVNTRVLFNDGDTFKILNGKYEKARVRISGMNTLESYGPVHEWEENTVHELFEVANTATVLAQNGNWNCKIEKEKDTYGRLLSTCDDLAKDLIGKGYAHAYSVDNKPADQEYLKMQKEAQDKRLGMWKDGIPKFIITSLHSVNEGNQKNNGKTYNRLISTTDGHTEKMFHQKSYATCEKVCMEQDKSCMVYVPYEIRYGQQRPDCLQGNS